MLNEVKDFTGTTLKTPGGFIVTVDRGQHTTDTYAGR